VDYGKAYRNAFIQKHKQGVLVGFDFADFRGLKASPSATKRQPSKPRKPQYRLVRVREKCTGKVFPTPSQIVTALAKRVLKSDYFIESGVAGTVQTLYIADGVEAKTLADGFPHGPSKPGDGKPARLVTTITVDAKKAEELARQLKLL
jgi:hypothetical protein